MSREVSPQLSSPKMMSQAKETPHPLAREFRKHYARLRGEEPPPFSIDFYPYSNLNHTIRVRNRRLLIRISDVLDGAPNAVVLAASVILLYKLFGRKVPKGIRQTYRLYVNREEVRRLIEKVRRLRGRKELTSPEGRVFDLRRLFESLNARFFENRVQVRHLSWSRRRSRRILGHYDGAHQTIVINSRLDSPLVPRFVVEYVLYHEMLHAVVEDTTCNGRRRIHHKRFRELERRFPQHRQAEAFIRRNFSR